MNAASFGHLNSRRFAALLQHLDRAGTDPVPLVYVVNSAGPSLMEGRTAFADAFALWPSLLHYADRHLVLTDVVPNSTARRKWSRLAAEAPQDRGT